MAPIACGEMIFKHAAAEFQSQVAVELILALFVMGDIADLSNLRVMEFAVRPAIDQGFNRSRS